MPSDKNNTLQTKTLPSNTKQQLPAEQQQ